MYLYQYYRFFILTFNFVHRLYWPFEFNNSAKINKRFIVQSPLCVAVYYFKDNQKPKYTYNTRPVFNFIRQKETFWTDSSESFWRSPHERCSWRPSSCILIDTRVNESHVILLRYTFVWRNNRHTNYNTVTLDVIIIILV